MTLATWKGWDFCHFCNEPTAGADYCSNWCAIQDDDRERKAKTMETTAKEARLTRTQRKLLEALRARRERADATEAEENARAIGGLTAREKFQRGAEMIRGGNLSISVVGATDLRTFRIHGAKVETFHALVDAGLAERDGFWVRAIVQCQTTIQEGAVNV